MDHLDVTYVGPNYIAADPDDFKVKLAVSCVVISWTPDEALDVARRLTFAAFALCGATGATGPDDSDVLGPTGPMGPKEPGSFCHGVCGRAKCACAKESK